MDTDREEYAEQYTHRERWRRLGWMLALTLVLMLLTQYGVQPRFEAAVAAAPCWRWNGFSGMQLLFYGVFTGMPLLFALISLPLVLQALRVWREGRFPPAGQKTFRLTRVRHGMAARAIGALQLAPTLMLLGIALWGAGQAAALLETLEARPVPAECGAADSARRSGHRE